MKTRWLAVLLFLIAAPQLEAQRTASNPLGAQLNVQDAGTCSTNGSFADQILPSNAATTTINLAGTFSGTLTIRLSNNGGASWTTNTSVTSAGTTSISTNGFTDVCADVTTFTSGVFQVTITTGLNTGPQGPPGPAGSGGASSLPSGGTVGQALINTAPGAGSWQDPNVSNTPMVLLNAAAATATQTSSAVKVPTQATSGVLWVNFAGITGAPLTCTIALQAQQSTGTANSATIWTSPNLTVANGTTPQYVTPTLAGASSADNLVAIWSCGTYPSAGTLTVTFNPQYASPSPSNGGFSNGTWVTTSEFITHNITKGFSGGSAGTACCNVTNFTIQGDYRILQPNGQIYDANANSQDFNFTIGGGNAGACTAQVAIPVNGWLQTIGAFVGASTGGVVQEGQVLDNIYISENAISSATRTSCGGVAASPGAGHHPLTAFNLANFFPCNWQTGAVLCGSPSVSGGSGATSAISVSNPSAGANATFANQSTQHYRILNIHFILTTGTTTGNRTVCLFMNSGSFASGQIAAMWCAAGIQPASTAITYDFSTGSSVGSGGNTFQQIIPIPANLQMPGGTGWQLATQVQGIQATDQISGFVALVQSYLENTELFVPNELRQIHQELWKREEAA